MKARDGRGTTQNLVHNKGLSLFDKSVTYVMPIDTRLSSVGFLSAVYPIGVSIVTFIIYAMEGRYAGYIPTVSETATEYPNTEVFACCIATGSTLLLASMMLYVVHLKYSVSLLRTEEFLLSFLAFFTFFGFLGLSFAPYNEIMLLHEFFASSALGALWLFQLISVHAEYKSLSTQMKCFRLGSIIITFLSGSLFGFSKHIFPDSISVTLSTIGEYLLIVFTLFIIVTRKEEYNSLSFCLVMENTKKEIEKHPEDVIQELREEIKRKDEEILKLKAELRRCAQSECSSGRLSLLRFDLPHAWIYSVFENLSKK